MARQAWSNSTENRKRRDLWRRLFSGFYLYLKGLGYEAEDFGDDWKQAQAVLSLPHFETMEGISTTDSRLLWKRDMRREAAKHRWIKRRALEEAQGHRQNH